jgi:hypothetical protein
MLTNLPAFSYNTFYFGFIILLKLLTILTKDILIVDLSTSSYIFNNFK